MDKNNGAMPSPSKRWRSELWINLQKISFFFSLKMRPCFWYVRLPTMEKKRKKESWKEIGGGSDLYALYQRRKRLRRNLVTRVLAAQERDGRRRIEASPACCSRAIKRPLGVSYVGQVPRMTQQGLFVLQKFSPSYFLMSWKLLCCRSFSVVCHSEEVKSIFSVAYKYF